MLDNWLQEGKKKSPFLRPWVIVTSQPLDVSYDYKFLLNKIIISMFSCIILVFKNYQIAVKYEVQVYIHIG